jgi:hypothetical protein
MSNDFVSAAELKKRKADVLKAQADQEAAEEAVRKAHVQAQYESRLPILTEELRPYIRQIFQKTITLAMALEEPDWGGQGEYSKHLLTDPAELIIVEPSAYSSMEKNYGGEFSNVGIKKEYSRGLVIHYVELKLDMSEGFFRSADSPHPWGTEPAAGGAWQTVTEELSTELLPLGYRITFEYIAGFRQQIGGDDYSEPSIYYTGPGCIIRIEW